jgi:hypothetical protein
MVRTLGRILVALLVAAGLVIGGAYALPREGEARAVATIAAPPAAVYRLASDLGRFGEWSPWPEFGPAARTVLSGADGAIGQALSWSSENPALGSGTLTITALEAARRVAALIDFGGAMRAGSVLAIEPDAGGSRVIWVFTADLGPNPLGRYLWSVSAARTTLESQLAAGLRQLAAIAEREAFAAPAIAAGPLPAIVVSPLAPASGPLEAPALTSIAPSSSLGL